MKSMQAVRAKSVSPTSRGLRLPFPCSEIVDLTQDDEEKREEGLSKRPHARSGWKSFPGLSGPVAWCLTNCTKRLAKLRLGGLKMV